MLLAAVLAVTGQAYAESVVVTVNWARLHAAPRDTARAVGIVYGNDVLQVLRTQDGWILVRTRGKGRGWISAQDVAPQGSAPEAPPGTPAPNNAEHTSRALPTPPPDQAAKHAAPPVPGAESPPRPEKATGPSGAGPDSPARVGQRTTPQPAPAQPPAATSAPELPPPPPAVARPAGTQPTAAPTPARPLSPEDIALQKAASQADSGHFLDAVSSYQELLKANPRNGRAFLGLLETLNAFMADALAAPNQANLSVAVSTYRQYFPTLPLPRDVQAKLQSVTQ